MTSVVGALDPLTRGTSTKEFEGGRGQRFFVVLDGRFNGFCWDIWPVDVDTLVICVFYICTYMRFFYYTSHYTLVICIYIYIYKYYNVIIQRHMWVIRPLSYGMIIRYHQDPVMNYPYCCMLYSWGRDIGMNQSDKTLKADRSLHSGDGDFLTKIHHEHLWEPEILDSLLGLSPLFSQHMIFNLFFETSYYLSLLQHWHQPTRNGVVIHSISTQGL